MPTSWEKEEFNAAISWRSKAIRGELNPIPCVSTWMDVCGFGGMLKASQWDLMSLQKSGALELLSEVYERVGHSFWTNLPPMAYENVLIINDGVARTVDLDKPEYIQASSAIFYIRDLVLGHLSLLRLTEQYGVGIRTVLAGGERIQYSPEIYTGNSFLYHGDEPNEHSKQLLEKNFLYNPAEFQMNTAFAKAYSIDAQGTKSGFNVKGFFVEKTFFEKFEEIDGLDIFTTEDSVLITHKSNPALELYIQSSVTAELNGLSCDVFSISALRVDASFEGEETLIDLINFQLPSTTVI